jgi:hypothetical protein
MSTSSTATRRSRRRLLLAAPRDQVGEFSSLVIAYQASGVDVELAVYRSGAPPTAAALIQQHPEIDALLLAGSARHAPRTVLPGPFLTLRDGRTVPAAWLPLRNRASTRRFMTAAVRVRRRARRRPTCVAVMGQWHPRYLHLASRMESRLPARVTSFRWTGEGLGRDELVTALGSGLGLGVYVGHGRPVGWVGYQGLRAHHFDQFTGAPLGGVVSLCCLTASRRRTGLSYSEALPLLGVAAASFGAVAPTRHTDNTRWAVGICAALAEPVDNLGDLLIRAAPTQLSARASYRIIGDPLAPLAAGAGAAARGGAVVTPF